MLLSVHRTGKDRRDQEGCREVNIDFHKKNSCGVRKEANMLWTIFVVLLILWGLGLMTGYTLGGVIHALLVIAIVVVLIQVIQGRRRA
jgi:hypothetical protein